MSRPVAFRAILAALVAAVLLPAPVVAQQLRVAVTSAA
jgi:hypothetical protein